MRVNCPISLFYDLLKSAFQAFCKHGFDGVHKFIRSYNSLGVIPFYNTYFCTQVFHKFFTKVTLSDPGFENERNREFQNSHVVTCCERWQSCNI